MPRTITVDNVAIRRILITRELSGNLAVYGEYDIRSGAQVVRNVHRDITSLLNSGQSSGASTLLDDITKVIQSAEVS